MFLEQIKEPITFCHETYYYNKLIAACTVPFETEDHTSLHATITSTNCLEVDNSQSVTIKKHHKGN